MKPYQRHPHGPYPAWSLTMGCVVVVLLIVLMLNGM